MKGESLDGEGHQTWERQAEEQQTAYHRPGGNVAPKKPPVAQNSETRRKIPKRIGEG